MMLKVLSEDDAPQKVFSGDETAQKVFSGDETEQKLFSAPHLSMAPATQHFAFPQKVLPTDAERFLKTHHRRCSLKTQHRRRCSLRTRRSSS